MESHLLQMRGLKPPDDDLPLGGRVASHLLQMRGLKPPFSGEKTILI